MLYPIEYSAVANKPLFGSHRFQFFLNSVIPRTQPTPKLCFLIKCNPLTLSAKCTTTPHDEHSFTASYLEENCGFSLESALALSKRVKLKNTENPNSVLSILRDYGFSETQINRVLQRVPAILRLDPVKSLVPKFEFFQSKGVSSSELSEMVTNSPYLLRRSLKNHIIPCFDVMKNLLRSEELAVSWMVRWPPLISHYNLKANIQVLLDSGVPELYVCRLLERRPTSFLRQSTTFREGVEKLKQLGFNPSLSDFLIAFVAMNDMSKAKWERKIEIFRKWGWTEDVFLTAFRRFPNMMLASESKIMAVMDFLVNQMGCDSMMVAREPSVLKKSLERRIIPRSHVVLYLHSKGLIRKDSNLVSPLVASENKFLEIYVKRLKEDAAHWTKLYEEKLKQSNYTDNTTCSVLANDSFCN